MSIDVIKKYNIWAKKSLGQNFLVDEEKLEDIISAIDIEGTNVIEVGPGYWALSEKILNHSPKSLHLVELDRDMIDILEDRIHLWDLLISDTSFQIHNTDVLEFTPEFSSYNVIANIPYYITSPILRRFLYDLENKPQEMLILMQKDVGDKILWKWKNKSSVLSLMVQKKCRVEERVFVPKESFIPAPKVESSVLYFALHDSYDDVSDMKFLEVIKKWFLAPRKKLIKNLVSGGYSLECIKDFFEKKWFSENIRGEDLDINDWIELVSYL